jgi:hypothetical protein
MPIIENADQIKQHNSAIEAGIELVNLQSFINDAIDNRIIPAIGLAQFDDIVANKSATAYLRAVHLVQAAIVGFMIADYTDNGSVTINSVGVMVSRSEKTAPASDKKLMQLRKSNLRKGYASLEMLINFLEDNIETFLDYKVSDAHKKNRSLFINQTLEFQDAGIQLNDNYQLYKSIRVHQANAEETFICPTLGKTISELLYSKILANTLTADQKTLIKKIQKPLAAFTMAEAIRMKAVSIDADGIFQLSETVGGISGNVENRNPPSDALLKRTACGFTMRGEQELETLRQFLAANAEKYTYTIPDAVVLNDGSAPNIYVL